MINHIEKGKYLNQAIREAGHYLRKHEGVWIADDDAAVQIIIDNFNPIPPAQEEKINELKLEAAKRANAIYGFLSGEDNETDASDVQAFYNFASDIYTSIIPAARDALSPRLQSFKDIRDTVATSITAINALNILSEIQSYDVVNIPAW